MMVSSGMVVATLRDGTSVVGETMDLSWLWWIPVVLIGLVLVAFIVAKLTDAMRRKPGAERGDP